MVWREGRRVVEETDLVSVRERVANNMKSVHRLVVSYSSHVH